MVRTHTKNVNEWFHLHQYVARKYYSFHRDHSVGRTNTRCGRARMMCELQVTHTADDSLPSKTSSESTIAAIAIRSYLIEALLTIVPAQRHNYARYDYVQSNFYIICVNDKCKVARLISFIFRWYWLQLC